jgi:hypothetical protein
VKCKGGAKRRAMQRRARGGMQGRGDKQGRTQQGRGDVRQVMSCGC